MPALRTVVGLAALVVIAGCTGTGVQTAPPVSVTPAPVPTDGTPTPAYRIAPGLTETGVVGPLALATAHADLLRSTVYRVRIVERVERSDGTVRWRVLNGTFSSQTRYSFTVREGVDNETVLASSLYANERRLYQRLVTDDSVRYYVPRTRLDQRSAYPEDPIGRPHQFDELYVALAGSRPAYIGTERVDGVTYHHLASRGPVNDDFLAAWEYVDAISEYSFVANVTDTGLVREYRISYVASVRDEQRTVVRTARWSGVGTASVPQPNWYRTALNRTTENRRTPEP